MSGEKSSYAAFRTHVAARGDRVDRIENAVGSGMFDVSCCFRPGVEFWMELKSPVEPARESTALFASGHPVLLTQINWSKTQIQAGGRAYFFVDTDLRRMFIDASHAEVMNKLTVKELLELSSWAAPKPTPEAFWGTLRSFIRGLASQSRPPRSLTSPTR